MSDKFYKWWENHRRVVTFGGFLILLSLYLSPLIKEAKLKNTCIKNKVHVTKVKNHRSDKKSKINKNSGSGGKTGIWGRHPVLGPGPNIIKK